MKSKRLQAFKKKNTVNKILISKIALPNLVKKSKPLSNQQTGLAGLSND